MIRLLPALLTLVATGCFQPVQEVDTGAASFTTSTGESAAASGTSGGGSGSIATTGRTQGQGGTSGAAATAAGSTTGRVLGGECAPCSSDADCIYDACTVQGSAYIDGGMHCLGPPCTTATDCGEDKVCIQAVTLDAGTTHTTFNCFPLSEICPAGSTS